MKFRQKFAAVLAALMLATSFPTFAASINGVNKTVTVSQGTVLDGNVAPMLKIELKDELTSGQAFYLSLENAEWDKDIASKLAADKNFEYALSTNNKQLEVKAKGDLAAKANDAYTIPMYTKVTGGDASVIIDSNDTVVTSGKYVFATSNSNGAIVTVADAKSFATTGKMADITIEESSLGEFQDKDNDKNVRFELEGKDFKFDYNKGDIIKDAFVGGKSYTGKKFDAKVIDETTLEVVITKNTLSATQRGSFTLTGIDITAKKGASYGEVNLTVSGDLNDAKELVVAKYGDYGTELKMSKEYTALAGRELKDVEFTLGETVADSINGNRETTFTFSDGVTIKGISVVKTEGLKADAAPVVATIEKDEDDNTNAFKVKTIPTDSNKKTSVTFKATLNVPASFDKNINLVVEGRSLEDKKEVEVAKVNPAVEVEVTAATVKLAAANQVGGKVVVKETDKGNLQAGKIFLAIDASNIKYTKAPEVKVTEGNLKVDEKVTLVDGGIEITVSGKSTKASTLEISGGELKVERAALEGKYGVKVGGNAISAHSAATLWDSKTNKYNDIDAITEKDFIIIESEKEENEVKNKSSFTIGQTIYTVNGEEKTMDTAAYISSGRTMLPVRYVADALGVDPTQILWDTQNKTVTILGDRVVQIKLGSKFMLINGTTVQMDAAAEMKNDRVFIPVAEIARALGANVVWDEVTKTATFN